MFRAAIAVLLLSVLAACGGGGVDDDCQTPGGAVIAVNAFDGERAAFVIDLGHDEPGIVWWRASINGEVFGSAVSLEPFAIDMPAGAVVLEAGPADFGPSWGCSARITRITP